MMGRLWESYRADTSQHAGGARTRVVVDLRDETNPVVEFEPSRRAHHRLDRFVRGSYPIPALTLRLVVDITIILLALVVTIEMTRPALSGWQIGLVGCLIGAPTVLVSGTYGFIPSPVRWAQLLRLAMGLALGAAIHSAVILFTGTSTDALVPVLLGWAIAGITCTVVRLAKLAFEDSFRLVPRNGLHLDKDSQPILSRAVVGVDQPVRHVLVIGGAGYIGSVLTRQLLDRGYRTTVLDRLVFGDVGVRELLDHPGFRLVKEDFRNVEALVAAATGADAVIHLGAVVGDPACALQPEQTIDVNYRATRLIRNVSRGVGVSRLIFASTCSVYGASESRIDEGSGLNPLSVYAASKISSERAVLEDPERSMASTVLRLATVFGWSPRPRFDLVVNLLTAKAVLEGEIDIINGHQWRPFISVQDVARGFVACLEAPTRAVRSQIFNVGDDRFNLTLEDLGNILSEIFPELVVNRRTDDLDRRSYNVSFRKVHETLGFTCAHSVVEGIHHLRRMIIETGISDYREEAYSNFSIMSQEPERFFGSITENLDPEMEMLRSLYELKQRDSAV